MPERPATVLVVEDEPDIRRITRLALAEVGGLDVQCCGDGDEALRVAAATRPDLILLDVMLPGMDGPATLEALRRNPETGDIPVIFVSAKVQRPEVAAYLGQGVIGVIPKPFDPMTLAAEVCAIWRAARPAAGPT